MLIEVVACGLISTAATSTDKPIGQLPKDAWNLATAWTEPFKGAAQESRRFDPISSLWFGLLEGSVESLERVASLLVHAIPSGEHKPGRPSSSGKALLRYSF